MAQQLQGYEVIAGVIDDAAARLLELCERSTTGTIQMAADLRRIAEWVREAPDAIP